MAHAATASTSALSEELRQLAAQKRILIGTHAVKKALLSGQLERIVLASNCPELLTKELKHLARLGNVEVIEPDLGSDRISTLIKKPFNALVLGVRKKA